MLVVMWRAQCCWGHRLTDTCSDMDKQTVDWDLLVEEVFKGEIEQFLVATKTNFYGEKNISTSHEISQSNNKQDGRQENQNHSYNSQL